MLRIRNSLELSIDKKTFCYLINYLILLGLFFSFGFSYTIYRYQRVEIEINAHCTTSRLSHELQLPFILSFYLRNQWNFCLLVRANDEQKYKSLEFCLTKSGYWKWCKFVFDVDIVVRIYRCGCDECVISRLDDSLRHSRSRINVYRALASPSLIALSSKDPILTAFEVSSDISGMFRFDYLLFSFNAAFVGIATLELFRA